MVNHPPPLVVQNFYLLYCLEGKKWSTVSGVGQAERVWLVGLLPFFFFFLLINSLLFLLLIRMMVVVVMGRLLLARPLLLQQASGVLSLGQISDGALLRDELIILQKINKQINKY